MKVLILAQNLIDVWLDGFEALTDDRISFYTFFTVILAECAYLWEFHEASVAIPITVEGSVANSIKEGDLVAVKLTYKDAKKEDATVISQIKVKSIKTSNGEDIIDGSAVAAFVIFDVTDEEQSDIKNALKEGNLYCSKYNNLSQKPLQKTYQVSDSQSSEVNPNDNTNTPQQ